MSELTQEIERVENEQAFIENVCGHPLAEAIYEQLNCTDLGEFMNTLQDVLKGGADAGFGGFIYHTETNNFYDENDTEIIKIVEETADNLGEEVLTVIAGFNCLNDVTPSEVAKVIYADEELEDEMHVEIKNALAWFALEEVARAAEY